MMAATTPDLRAFNGAAIPDELKAHPRWAPWRAAFNAKRGKFDKIPHRADTPEYGLSTANPDRWFTFKAAVSAYEREAPSFAGVGYVMTRPHGVVGVDLDDCVHDGHVADWAREIVEALASYTEVSPSGKGLRIFARGASDDWTNHTVGVEVYGGAEPRFLTLTGQHLPGTPEALRDVPVPALEALRARYGRDAERVDTPAQEMPELLDDLLLPDLAGLNIPYAARDFLVDGDTRGDRSRELHAAAVALFQCGLPDDEVLSLLASSPHAMEVALDHRRQDPDRALLYLWREHCIKAKPKGEQRRVATADDFEDVSEKNQPTAVAAQEQAASKSGADKPLRFQFQTLDEFGDQPPMSWLVKKVVPKAALGLIFGPSTAGKTFFALDLAMHIAQGKDWCGHRVKQTGVAYICAEDPAGFSLRVKAYRSYHGLEQTHVPMMVLGRIPSLLERQDTKDLVAALHAVPNLGVIFVDTLSKVTLGADENSSQDMGRALAHCEAIHRATGAMVVLIAHPGKDAARGVRGWSGLVPLADVVLSVDRDLDYRAATLTKVKNGMEGLEFPFKLNGMVVGEDEDGDPIESAVAVFGEAIEKARSLPKGGAQRMVLRVAEELAALSDQVLESELVAAAVAQMPRDPHDEKRDTRKQVAQRALKSLSESGHVVVQGGYVEVL